ncbi:SIS domain-containing protein [Pasteurella skyensis]|uniref:SIS domain-containing protein n=1 Tax=Phocoenobacter skyensis TaxID=97481 RepID=A0AAJ6P049_9PAST|nr:SIS domain-containing protein [Pasteurella skyensis]MDP8162047.1 SIS domain-containing protein [Pasteurella skyensis]MDP8172203.1 SIS domain-containing protein [Pasteurella skyensis]MDP8176448.1 SIS domain-containing protein [Pasteurella skyensis]MDP8178337.1 SIS domain-containing protein [Pasteurella skyensis]MDP8182907.1 SIS domain-containing protein [Pasteurella skyensis]
MLQKIQDRFSESIQIQIASSELLPTVIHQAASRIVECLLRGNKVIVCGSGRSYGNAQLLVSHLSHRYELARPSFSAILLSFEGILATVSAQDNEIDLLYKKKLQAVATEGDILVAFSPFGNEELVLNAIYSAVNENLGIIAFTSSHNNHTSGLLAKTDTEIVIPSNNEMRIIEGHLFGLNLMCEAIDALLFS